MVRAFSTVFVLAKSLLQLDGELLFWGIRKFEQVL
jgi:hypothetical protein